VGEEAIYVNYKFWRTDGRTDGQTTRRRRTVHHDNSSCGLIFQM